jgi:hypothetical protein
MKINLLQSFVLALGLSLSVASVAGHEVTGGTPHEHPSVTVTPLSFIVEKRGPVRAPKAIQRTSELKVSGQGFWKFVACPELTPVPAAAHGKVKPAHGTIIWDQESGNVYWGLQNVGWIGFSNQLRDSWIVAGDPVFGKGNLHGADILYRRGKAPLIAAADNNNGQVFITDTTFARAEVLGTPTGQPYADGKGFRPTDVAFVSAKEVWVTDGYGKAWFMPADAAPFKYQDKYFGGKSFSQTPHGVTFDAKNKLLLVSARPEGQVKRFDLKREEVLEIGGLPPGSTVCDVDVWGDYALAPCLDGPDKSNGPIYIINLKKRAVVATIKPKDDLGYAEALHIHDAAWYITGRGRNQEIYIVFTNWNPGGVGALKLVNLPD